ncbi:MAG: gamma-glutamyl-gamma-aminobutyrate hydrolase family protein [Deltaproteobacteria bacterium]|nr:gamma-glutamyl-gamma-aminobutyrate hydrolase family protein [Deltaproteobacteria bacterium]
MKAPLIGLTTREHLPSEDSIPYVCTRKAYIDSIVEAGGAPILIPHTLRGNHLRRVFDLLDGIVLTGGEDVDPRHYNHPPHPKLGAVSAERDACEIQLIEWALTEHTPLLAICRGLQILNVALGGTLYQDLEAEHRLPTLHRQGEWEEIVHSLTIEPQSQLAAILGTTTIGTNSLHHQAIRDLSPKLRAVATTDDELIEGVEVVGERFAIGVQAHPEVLWPTVEPRWLNLFREFVQATKEAGSEVAREYQALQPYRP